MLVYSCKIRLFIDESLIKLLYQFVSIRMSSSILFPTNQYATSSKSSEEIQKLTVPEGSTLTETLAHIASKGLPSQWAYLYRHMHLAYKTVLSFACSKAPSQDSENQILIATSMKKLLEEFGGVLTGQQLQMIFESCLECLNNLHSPGNEQVGTVLERVIRLHPDSKKLTRRLEEASLQLGKQHQPIISKLTSARLISFLAQYVGRTVKGEMVDILKRVLADSEIQAKKVWLTEIFPRLLQNLDLQFIELHLQEKIYESVWDENEEVGILALQVILKNATRFSIQQQSSRIVKLFIDSLTSKRQKMAIMGSQLMGEAYEKLLNIILKNQNNCIRFWKSLIQISQSRNQRILNNLAYNLPGILLLSAPIYKVEALCDVYIELFYQPHSNKLLLASYFHQVATLFPGKASQLKDLTYWILNQLFEQEDPYEEAIRIVSKILQQLLKCHKLFLVDHSNAESKDKPQQKNPQYFESNFCEFLIKYLVLLTSKKNCSWLSLLYASIRQCYEFFSPQFVQSALIPKLYSCLRSKTPCMDLVVDTLAALVSRDGSPVVINTYVSKINVQLTKSTKSYERQTALQFFYYASQYLSIETFQEYRLGQKYLYFNNDKSFRVRAAFILHLPRLNYFFTREQKIENAIILSRLTKDVDPEIQQLMESTNFTEEETIRQQILESSRRLKQRQRQKITVLTLKKQQAQIRRSSKQLKKEDVLKKRIQTTKSKTKMLIKDVPKKKVAPVLVKTTSNLNFRKNS